LPVSFYSEENTSSREDEASTDSDDAEPTDDNGVVGTRMLVMIWMELLAKEGFDGKHTVASIAKYISHNPAHTPYLIEHTLDCLWDERGFVWKAGMDRTLETYYPRQLGCKRRLLEALRKVMSLLSF
jgi:hypothetical protein